jgi:hypothetical protein
MRQGSGIRAHSVDARKLQGNDFTVTLVSWVL